MNTHSLRSLAIVLVMLIGASVIMAADLERFLVRSYLTDDGWKLLDSVNVVSVTKNDTIPVDFKVLSRYGETNMVKGGQLRMMINSGYGDYTIVLEKEGYEPVIKNFRVASTKDETMYLDMITFEKERFKKLGEVTVTATRVKMVMKGDTMVFDANAFELQDGSMLDALVRQLPGASIDQDGVIAVNGRKINELLVNGKDFFKGDPKVALQNLPAYTVKNVKVYDKAAEDAYLTKSNAKWTKREDEENLVMDVNLKKEYDTGWMANVEAGGGTDSRWKLRGFGLGYTDKFRLAVFGNFNNVGDVQTASASGGWMQEWGNSGSSGIPIIKKGGADYTYSYKKVKLTGNVVAEQRTNDLASMTSTTQFYPERNLYQRSTAGNLSRSNTLSTYHDITVKGDNVYFNFRPSLSWNVNNSHSNTRSAVFADNPVEQFRGEAIDSLFSRGSRSRYFADMFTRMHNMTVIHGNSLNASGFSTLTYSPKKLKGSFSLGLSGNYGTSPSRNRMVYIQEYGPQGDASAAPQNTDRYNVVDGENRSFRSNLRYSYTYNKFTETNRFAVSLGTEVNYAHDDGHNSAQRYLAELNADADRLPSLSEPAGAIRDYENSFYSRTNKNDVGGELSLGLSGEPMVPGDSTFNLSYNMSLRMAYTHSHESLDYDKPTVMYQSLEQDYNNFSPSLFMSIGSANDLRYMSLYMAVYIGSSCVPLMQKLNMVDTSDPFNIYVGNPDGLKDMHMYNVGIGFQRYGRTGHRARIMTYLNMTINQNQLALARTYNPLTGVTENRYTNVNGNWSMSGSFDYNMQVGPRNQVELHGWINSSFQNSVDFQAIDTTPIRSSVRNLTVYPNLGVLYRFKNGSTVSTGWGVNFNKSTSPRKDFVEINSHNITGQISGNLKLPFKFEVNTQMQVVMRRGYSDASLNTSNWVWNADVIRSFLKGSALTLKLTAYDILNTQKQISLAVNAQGRTETWRNALRRYVMLSAIYRFDMKPKSKR
ncbi:MAG: outer membrane beta-barrel family protein [Muribaculaceae bacterium]|nr:outer membrane beta-barrel family protein [Muribaculaceae bacterium]